MALDFTTLYVVILFNSILMAIVWSVIYRSYERQDAAGIWALSSLMAIAAGVVLASEAFVQSLVPIYIGNLLVVLAFSLYWAGIRRFAGRPMPWRAITAILVVMAAVLPWITFVEPNYNARNVVYAVAQSVPLAFSISDLLRLPDRSPGRRIAVIGMSLAIFGHVVESVGNLLQVTGGMSRASYGIVEPAVVLIVVFSAVLWNYGLVLGVLDRIYGALQRRALVDELTGLANRRALTERLDAEIAAASASGRPLSLLVVDLDGLKRLNDRHGHQTGDAGIVHVAHIAPKNLRAGDLMARTGGDEFCVILPDANAETAGALAAALVGAVRDVPLAFEEKTLPLTLSIGAAQWQPGQTGDALSAAADAALYEAKARGRNRHVVAGHEDDIDLVFRTAPAETRA